MPSLSLRVIPISKQDPPSLYHFRSKMFIETAYILYMLMSLKYILSRILDHFWHVLDKKNIMFFLRLYVLESNIKSPRPQNPKLRVLVDPLLLWGPTKMLNYEFWDL